MANARKAKGTRAESGTRDRLRAWGVRAYRPAQEGRLDVGDLHGVEPFVLQVKDWTDTTAALREGRIVLAIPTSRRDQSLAVVAALLDNGGHFVNRFGGLETEEFARWRGAEPVVSSLLK